MEDGEEILDFVLEVDVCCEVVLDVVDLEVLDDTAVAKFAVSRWIQKSSLLAICTC